MILKTGNTIDAMVDMLFENKNDKKQKSRYLFDESLLGTFYYAILFITNNRRFQLKWLEEEHTDTKQQEILVFAHIYGITVIRLQLEKSVLLST